MRKREKKISKHSVFYILVGGKNAKEQKNKTKIKNKKKERFFFVFRVESLVSIIRFGRRFVCHRRWSFDLGVQCMILRTTDVTAGGL